LGGWAHVPPALLDCWQLAGSFKISPPVDYPAAAAMDEKYEA